MLHMVFLSLYSGIVSPHLDEKINDFMLSVWFLVSVLVALDCHSLGGAWLTMDLREELTPAWIYC
jgi:hypothetical protein